MAFPPAFYGVQISPHTFLDEGVEPTLDLLRSVAVDTLVLYPMTVYGVDTDKHRVVARQAACNTYAERDGHFARVTFQWRDNYLRDTALGRPADRPGATGIGRDLVGEACEAARARGMRVYLRLLEPCWGNGAPESVPNWSRVRSYNARGELQTLTSPGHADYVNWILGIVEGACRHYPLAGFKYGYERSSPLATVMAGKDAGTGFDDQFMARARAAGIDPEAARRATLGLVSLLDELRDADAPPPGGTLDPVLRHLFKNPVLLQWDKLWYDAMEELPRKLHALLKSIEPALRSGRHIAQGAVLCDPFDRAQIDYADMATYTDWIKPSVYPTIGSPRFRAWGADRYRKAWLRSLSDDDATRFLYHWTGQDPDACPPHARLWDTAQPASSVGREIARTVSLVRDRAQVVSGVGFDIPWWGPQPISVQEDPALVADSVTASLRAGAAGILLCREYDEMSLAGFEAAARAYRAFIR